MPGKRKGKPSLKSSVGVTSVLLVSQDLDSGDAQDMDGLGRARAWA
jgi:hypothetical protein